MMKRTALFTGLAIVIQTLLVPVQMVQASTLAPADEELNATDTYILGADGASTAFTQLQFDDDTTDGLIEYDSGNSNMTISVPTTAGVTSGNLIFDSDNIDVNSGGDLKLAGVALTLDANNTSSTGNFISIVAEQGTNNNGFIIYNPTDQVWKISNAGALAENIVSDPDGAIDFEDVFAADSDQTLTLPNNSSFTIDSTTGPSLASPITLDTDATLNLEGGVISINGNTATSSIALKQNSVNRFQIDSVGGINATAAANADIALTAAGTGSIAVTASTGDIRNTTSNNIVLQASQNIDLTSDSSTITMSSNNLDVDGVTGAMDITGNFTQTGQTLSIGNPLIDSNVSIIAEQHTLGTGGEIRFYSPNERWELSDDDSASFARIVTDDFDMVGTGESFIIKDDGTTIAQFNSSGAINFTPNTGQFLNVIGGMVHVGAKYYYDTELNDFWTVSTNTAGTLQFFNDDLTVANSVFINGAGTLGLGTALPGARIHAINGVLGSNADDTSEELWLQSATDNADILRFFDRRQSTCGGVGACDWTTAGHRIQRRIDATDMGYIEFGSMNDDLITFGEDTTEYMRIDGAGEVGIGTTSPDYDLEVEAATNAAIMAHSPGNSLGGIVAFPTQRVAFLSTNVNDDLVFGYSSDPANANLATSFNEYMRLKSSNGRLGLGTDTPGAPLHIYSTWNGALATLEQAGSEQLARLELRGDRTTNTTSPIGSLIFTNKDGGNIHTSAEIFTVNHTATSDTDDSSELRFRVNRSASTAELMQIIGSTAFADPSVRIFSNPISSTSLNLLELDFPSLASNPATTNRYIRFTTSSGFNLRGSISGNGSGGVQYNTTSDLRTKTNIEDLEGGLDLVMQTRPIMYNSIEEPDGKKTSGFVAQEMYKIFPSVVSGDPDSDIEEDGPMQIAYGALTPVLTSAIQELNQKVDDHIADSGHGADVQALIDQVGDLVNAVNALYEPKSLTGFDWFGSAEGPYHSLKWNSDLP